MIVGACTLAVIASILLVLNVSAYYSTVVSTVVEGAIIVRAVLGSSANGNTQIRDPLRRWSRGQPSRTANDARAKPAPLPPSISLTSPDAAMRIGFADFRGSALQQWMPRNRETLRLVLPSYVLLIVAIAIAHLAFGAGGASFAQYANSLFVLAAFAVILGLGQGAVILTGGLDLSIPWTVALCAALLCGWVNGANDVSVWAGPAILVLGAAVGLPNGCGIVFSVCYLSLMTLAMSVILQAAGLLYNNGTPHRSTSPIQSWFMTGHLAGIVPAVIFLVAFIVFANALLNRTAFGRWIYAVCNSMRAAPLSELPVDRTIVGICALNGVCSALVGIMLVGFNGQAFNGMSDRFCYRRARCSRRRNRITGGRGHYLGILGGACC